MSEPSEEIKSLNWTDDSPPNILSIGQVIGKMEAEQKAKGYSFPENYPGAEAIFESVMIQDFSFNEIAPLFETYLVNIQSFNDEEAAINNMELLQDIAKIVCPQKDAPKQVEGGPHNTVIELDMAGEDDITGLLNYAKEAIDIIENLDDSTPKLISSKGDATLLNNLFRDYHTIKGASGFFGLEHISTLTHQMENVLDRARKGFLEVDDEVVNILIKGNNWLQQQFSTIRQELDGAEAPFHLTLEPGETGPIHYGCLAIASRPDKNIEMDEIENDSSVKENSIRISQTYMDQFLNSVGNLINLAHVFKHSEAILETSNLDRDMLQRFKDNFLALEFETESLQKKMMQLRRVKMELLLKKIPKIIFKLSQIVGKQVKVESSGEDIEIDKSMLEALEDPMVHILRNSMDHGFENTDTRIERGKSETGLLQINVEDDNNNIRITISEDGNGVDPDRVAAIAIEKGIIQETQVETMNERQKQELIFTPGFSTNAETTEISGRGVGMDVVKSQIISVGGSVKLKSELGIGTSIIITLPKIGTLATRSVLKVQVGQQYYGIPLNQLEYLYSSDTQKTKLPKLENGMELFPFRGKNLPVIHLGSLIGTDYDKNSETRNFLIINTPSGLYTIEVDRMDEFETLVIQDLKDTHFKNTPFEGGAIMGDGNICLLTSIDDMLSQANLENSAKNSYLDSENSLDKANKNKNMIIVQPIEDDQWLSFELENINRIEKFDPSKLTIFKSHKIYHSALGLLPYFEFSDFGIGRKLDENEAPREILVFRLGEKLISIGVYELIDMYYGEVNYIGAPRLVGISNTWTYNKKIVGYLDPEHIEQVYQQVHNKHTADTPALMQSASA